VAYELISEHTNFLLVHVREEGEKSKDMPELQKVAQMMAAGWGGVGSVVASTANAFFESRSIDYDASSASDAFDINAPVFARSSSPAFANVSEAPAVFRTVGKRSVMFSRSMDLDVPSFLRKQSGGIDKADARLWSHTDHYTGLTPLGLAEMLRTTPVAEWPKTYVDLHRIELGVSVVDWLELAVANSGGQRFSEDVVVASFLYLMSQRDTYESLAKPLGTMQGFKIMAQRLKGLFTAKPVDDHPEIDVKLVEFMLTALADMKADAWPDQVDALASQS
jgi:Ca-activated chloride channel family protein